VPCCPLPNRDYQLYRAATQPQRWSGALQGSGAGAVNYDLLTILVAITSLATFALWRNTNRPTFKQLNKKFRKALWESNPVEPKHDKPKFEPFRNVVAEWEAKFFYDFADFADVMNWYLADDAISSPWRLQELPYTDVSRAGDDGPTPGRAWAVFHNQMEVGKLEIHGGVFYGKDESDIYTRLELHWVRLLGYDEVAEFLTILATHVVDPKPQNSEYVAATNAINAAMLKALWDSNRISKFDLGGDDVNWGELELRLHGTPTFYSGRRDCQAFAELKRARKIAA
jgi:hypothetical protein